MIQQIIYITTSAVPVVGQILVTQTKNPISKALEFVGNSLTRKMGIPTFKLKKSTIFDPDSKMIAKTIATIEKQNLTEAEMYGEELQDSTKKNISEAVAVINMGIVITILIMGGNVLTSVVVLTTYMTASLSGLTHEYCRIVGSFVLTNPLKSVTSIVAKMICQRYRINYPISAEIATIAMTVVMCLI